MSAGTRIFLLRAVAYATFLIGLSLMIKLRDAGLLYYTLATLPMGMGLFWTIRTIIMETLQQEKIK